MITIQWDTGYMIIDPEKFFPCSLKTLKSLKKKVIDIACPWSHRDEVIAQIRDHLRERVKNTDSESHIGKRLSRQSEEVETWE